MVAATGTGKTVMAAIDYRSLRQAGRVETLLYVAHRREILEQARRIFRHVLQMRDFGELLYQGERPAIQRHVFASIDSLGDGAAIDPAAFDHVILDEAHHAAANSWEKLLERVAPKELLGLTGTPERADGLDYERHFPRPWVGNLRVWNAIPHALVPFRYYMLDVEGADLRDLDLDRRSLRARSARRPTRGRGRGVRVAGGPGRYRVHRAAVRDARHRVLRECPPRRRGRPPFRRLWLLDPGGDRQHRQRRATRRSWRSRRRPGAGAVRGRHLQRRRRRSQRQHAVLLPPDRECHGVPPTVRARPASCAWQS